MVQGGMDRRIAGIIRWLERFQSSYRSGAIESALMDAECARADLEDLRSDVWRSVGAARTPRRVRRAVVTWLASLVLLAVLAVPSPLSREEGLVGLTLRHEARAVAQEPERRVETPLPAPAESAPVPPRSVKAERRPPSDRRTRAAAPAPRLQRVTAVRPAPQERGTVPDDKMFLLLQTGARALRNEGPAIRIDRVQ